MTRALTRALAGTGASSPERLKPPQEMIDTERPYRTGARIFSSASGLDDEDRRRSVSAQVFQERAFEVIHVRDGRMGGDRRVGRLQTSSISTVAPWCANVSCRPEIATGMP
ncbi:hypothetical protein N7376_24260 [Brucella intermedia GD04153]|uniref:Uncharacterized protein n=1 Tax=Brucella intermedia GD04153 TaxID=2975438 RepID=A0AA42HBN0_9HYPH|nr:hypothetical protein [Brucella intermedia]MDH0127086.1 hypothetical protein [Brucella intermedia GD04153]RRD21518.1 hypothetical protein ECB98_23920 [Brucellaceae bacterium VT-16-1752]